MGEHSIIAPSSADRRAQCPGSAVMEAMHPETAERPEAKEGTAAHELATDLIQHCARTTMGPKPWSEYEGRQASNGVDFTERMYEAAMQYVDEVRGLMRRAGVFGGPHLFLERRIAIPHIHEQSAGTPDFAVWGQRTRTLYVRDFKYGYRIKEPDCKQLVEYAIGVLDTVLEGRPAHEAVRIDLGIVQPRAPHRKGKIRTRVISAAQLYEEAEAMAAIEAEALGDNPRTITGEECRDCKGRHACATLKRSAMTAVDSVGHVDIEPLDEETLAEELRLLRHAEKLLTARRKGLEAQAEGFIRAGRIVPGFALEPSVGRVVWRVPDSEIIDMCDLMGVDARKPAQAITPKQAEKLGIDESVIKAYSGRDTTGVKLVESDQTLAGDVFGRKEEK